MQVGGLEADHDGDLHAWGNIPRVFPGVLHIRYNELSFLQRSDLYSLNVL